jgi:hypothetical protein
MARQTSPPAVDRPDEERRVYQSGKIFRLMTGIGLAVMATHANAQDRIEVVGQFLAIAGLSGGALGGVIAGWRQGKPLVFWQAFLVYLGGMAMLASTRAGSMEILPLALVLGALVGIGPFAASFYLARHLTQRACARWRRADRPAGPNGQKE